MRCIFCKRETTESEPLEHILPESLGNTEHVLRRGLVCGNCNNYFARKVEKPFLDGRIIQSMRFDQAVPNKRGLVPPQHGIILENMAPIEMIREPHDWDTSINASEAAAHFFQTKRRGTLIFPIVPTLIEPNSITSRFLGKVAIEAFAHKMQDDDELLAEIVSNEQLDALRDHVRNGKHLDWPISIRRIYSADARWMDLSTPSFQIMHEFDFLVLENMEFYFILALFGQEMVINLGGPSLEGWERWLDENHGKSPLQIGRNAGKETPLPE